MNMLRRVSNTRHLRRLAASALAILPLAILTSAGVAHAADKPFYDGKTVTFIIANPPGGSSDIDCRVLAQYLGDHIAGHPTIIAKNMGGAAGMIGANYVGLEGKKDGTMLMCGLPAATSQLFKDPSLKVDLTKFSYILGDGSAYTLYARKDTTPPLSQPADFLKAQNLTLGGTLVAAAHDLGERLYLDTLGLKYKYVTGLNGDAGGRTAIQQKFINVYMEQSTAYQQITVPSLVKTGDVLPLFQTGLADKNLKLTIRDPRMPDLPTFREYYQSVTGKPAQGPKIEMIDEVMGVLVTSVNILAMPPGAPKEAVEAFRAAVGPLNKDKDFVAAAEKIRGPGPQELDGATVTKIIDNYLSMPKNLVDQFNDMITSGNAMAQSSGK